jgi:hypothetical protein
MYFYTSDSILVEITKPAYAWRQTIAYILLKTTQTPNLEKGIEILEPRLLRKRSDFTVCALNIYYTLLNLCLKG